MYGINLINIAKLTTKNTENNLRNADSITKAHSYYLRK